MKNTFDILVNFKKYAYEFYEWEKDDDIKHVKTIPTFRVSLDCLRDFMNCNLIVEKSFLDVIRGKTEVFCKGIIKVLDYCCILFCGEKVVAVVFDNDGNLIGKSNLLFDEADDVVLSCNDLTETKINYKIISKTIHNYNCTRKESKKINYLLNYVNDIYGNNSDYEIRYVYFECFNKMLENNEEAYLELKKQIENYNFDIIEKLTALIKVLKK